MGRFRCRRFRGQSGHRTEGQRHNQPGLGPNGAFLKRAKDGFGLSVGQPPQGISRCCRQRGSLGRGRWPLGKRNLKVQRKNTMKLTRENLHALSGSPGQAGFTRKQIEMLGFDWPPVKGWLTSLIGTEIGDDLYASIKEQCHPKWKGNMSEIRLTKPDLFDLERRIHILEGIVNP